MEGGNLQNLLANEQARKKLSFRQRVSILLDIAQALAYMHQRPERALHQSVQPSNILLDRNYAAKLAEVGVARMMPEHKAISTRRVQESMSMMKGKAMFVYTDPKYFNTGTFGRASDVYSFGWVGLFLMTGRLALVVMVGVYCWWTVLFCYRLRCYKVESV